MKIVLFAFCVVLPSICLGTPLPDGTAVADSASDAKAQVTGTGDASATSSSNADASVSGTTNPPGANPPTPPGANPTTPPGANPPTPPGTNPPPAPDAPAQPGTAPSPPPADQKATASATADGKADADSKGQGSGKDGASVASSSSATAQATVQGFTNYCVLTKVDEFKTKIEKTTWFVAKYTVSQEKIQSDVAVCADRYIGDGCKAVKFQYTCDKDNFVLKEWGYDGNNLIYIQENISFSSQDFVIMKAEVVNVMKATKDKDIAISVDNADQVKSSLSSEYAVLGTDYKTYFIGQTSSEKGAITFVAFNEEFYGSEEKQTQVAEAISKILKDNGIDESKLSKLTEKFDVDTNKYNKVKQESNVSSDGNKVTTEQKTTQETANGSASAKTELTTSNGAEGANNAPSGTADAKASSSSDAHVDSTGGGKADAKSSSDAKAEVNTGN